jgi:ATP-binding cassette subfamily B protein
MTGADLGAEIYKRTLYQPYIVHIGRNSSEVIDGINKAHGVITTTIVPILTLISSSITLIFVFSGLLYLDAASTLGIFLSFGLIYYGIGRASRNRIYKNSELIARSSTNTLKYLMQGLGGIRDILLDGSQKKYYETYRIADERLRHAQGNNAFIAQSPRYVIEALGMVLITIFAYILAKQDSGVSMVVPIIGVVAIGAQRMLPLLQQLFGAVTNMRSGRACLQDTLALLEQPMPSYAEFLKVQRMPFKKSIVLDRITFQYSQISPVILRDVCLTIQKGDRIGFFGKSGCGKSTLLDIVMGLLVPISGKIEIDDMVLNGINLPAWQANIAHVPQTIYLADGTILENITFGISSESIDLERAKAAAKKAQLSELIESWPNGYETTIGERGVLLSGGQRQRIGVARALYKNADLIIFDEATSALDGETESILMESIESLSLDLTIIIVAHRLTTLKVCNKVIEIGGGTIIQEGSYNEVIKKND